MKVVTSLVYKLLIKMIKNNKGFMLAEVVIVSAVIMTCLVTLYTSFNKMYNLYKDTYNYLL